MRFHRTAVPLVVVLLVLTGAVGLAAAHETETVNGYEMTFGGTDEPVITGERMWLQIELVDAETGEPVEGRAESIEMAVQRPFGNDTFELDVSEAHGSPGVYQGAIVFTEPGTYTVYVNGTVNGTSIDTTFSKQVHDANQLEYPGGERTAASGGMLGGFGGSMDYGLGAVTAFVAVAIGFVAGRRR